MLNSSTERIVGDIRLFKHEYDMPDVTFKQFLAANSPHKLKQIGGFFRDAVKRNTIVDAWLEYNYGWKPLIRDVKQGSDALNELVNGQDQDLSFSFKAGARRTEEIQSDSWVSPAWTGTKVYGEALKTSECHFSCRVKLPDGTLRDLRTMGLDNPLEVAWELVPYSFVVDWFLDVGGWISSIGAQRGITFIEGSRTLFQTVVSSSEFELRGDPGTTVLKYPRRGGRIVCGRMERSLLTSLPIAYLPAVKERLGLYHLATGLSLLTKLVR